MSRPSWTLLWGTLFTLAGCAHPPTVADAQLTTLTPTQLTSVHADEASVAQAQQDLARQEKDRQDAEAEKDRATDERSRIQDAIDGKQKEIDARKKEKEQLEQQLDTAEAHVDAAAARIEWIRSRIESARAEVAHRQALAEQAKYQALVNAKDPSVQTLKAEDFAQRVQKTAETAKDRQADAVDAQQRYEKQRASWQSQAQKD